jgi:hypothetical protein
VRVVEHSVRKEKEAFTYQGLTTCAEVDWSWTILSSTLLLSARQLQTESAVTAPPPCFPNAGRGTVRFPSETNKGRPHTERICTRGAYVEKTVFCEKAKRSKKEQMHPPNPQHADNAAVGAIRPPVGINGEINLRRYTNNPTPACPTRLVRPGQSSTARASEDQSLP